MPRERSRLPTAATIGLAALLPALSALAPSPALATPSASRTARTSATAALPTSLRSATVLGAARPATRLGALIALRHTDEPGLLRFDASVSDPASPLYRHYLTPAQFDTRFAPSRASVAAVVAFAEARGLRVTAVPSNRAYVYVTGTVAELEHAFATSIDRFRFSGADFLAPTHQPSLPGAVARLITGIDGLDTGEMAQPASASETPPTPAYVNAPPFSSYWDSTPNPSVPGYGSLKELPDVPRGYTPQQIEGAYGMASALRAGLTGRGVTVAVIDAYSSPTIVGDADEWSRLHGLPKPQLTLEDNAAERDQPEVPSVPTDVPVAGGIGIQDPNGWFAEETLDVEAVHTMAPGARIVVQSATSAEDVALEMAQNNVVSKHLADVISNSYGGDTDSTDSTSDGYWQQAAAEGISVLFSAGDDGDGTSGGTQPDDRTVDQDANSPYVTSVGGTTLEIGRRDNYERETYWGTDTATLTNGKWGQLTFESGGGGGTSEVYAEPSFQKGVVPTRYADYWKGNKYEESGAIVPGRVVPDVAMLADPNSGFLMGQTEDFSAYANPGGLQAPGDTDRFGQYRIGGTSLASPLLAGVVAVADQAAGTDAGFLDPALYRAHGTRAFHDVVAPKHTVAVARTNYVNSTNASGGIETLLRTAGNLGTLQSVRGYDDSTGLGTPDGAAFLQVLAPHSPIVRRLVRKQEHRTKPKHRRSKRRHHRR